MAKAATKGLLLLLVVGTAAVPELVFRDSANSDACTLAKNGAAVESTCDLKTSSGTSLATVGAVAAANEKEIAALKRFVCQKEIAAAGGDMVYSPASSNLLGGFCPVACQAKNTEFKDGKCKLATGPVLEAPTDVGGGVRTFCRSGCSLTCPAGAKGPGWYLPGGSDDARAELRWDGIELNKNYFTVAMWVKRDNRDSDIGLFSYGDYPTDQGFMVQMRASDFHVRAASSERPSFGSYDSGAVGWSNSMIVSQWAHVAVVKDGSEIRYYINGKSVGRPNRSFAGKPHTMPAHRHLNVGSWFEGAKILQGYVSNIHVFSSDSDSAQAYSNAAMKKLYDIESGFSGC